jgi:hypothetical protein
VKSPFHPTKRTIVPVKETYRYTHQQSDKASPLQSLPTKHLNHPDPLQMWQIVYSADEEMPNYAKVLEKTVALQVVMAADLQWANCRKNLVPSLYRPPRWRFQS